MKLSIVVPCYNEEAVLPISAPKFKEVIDNLIAEERIEKGSKIVFVDDGSKDKTWDLITELNRQDDTFLGIKLSRNKGHQNALLAGLLSVKDSFDAAVSVDADLQDDVEAIYEMIESYKRGNEIVYGVRKARKNDSFFKRKTASLFYKIMNLLGAETIPEHADFRLMSKKAINALGGFTEVNLFLRGIVTLIGFKSDKVYYERGERKAGESKYPLRKMLSFAGDGITSFSVKPIELILRLGILIVVFGLVFLIYALVRYILDQTTAGWTSLFGSIWVLGGLQLVSIGVIGKYIGKIYLETKGRPRYIIEENMLENLK